MHPPKPPIFSASFEFQLGLLHLPLNKRIQDPMGGVFSAQTKRCPAILSDHYAIYDLTLYEWKDVITVREDGQCYFIRIRGPLTDKFHVVVKRDLVYILVLYTSLDEKEAETVYANIKKTVNVLDPVMPLPLARPKIRALMLYTEVMQAYKQNPAWSASHIAAKAGLITYFEAALDTSTTRAQIHDDLAKQFLPDLSTPLHLAIASGHVAVVQLLFKSFKPKLELVDAMGYSILHTAAISSADVLTLVLAQEGMIPDRVLEKTANGCMPLLLACYAKKPENIRIFLRAGLPLAAFNLVPPHERLMQRRMARRQGGGMAPVRKGPLKIRPPIAPNQTLSFTDDDIDQMDMEEGLFYGGTPLHWTMRSDDVERYVGLGFELDAVNARGETALIIKTRQGFTRTFLALLCAGADVNVPDWFHGDTALHHAVKQCSSQSLTYVQALLVFDADIERLNDDGESPRHLAALGVVQFEDYEANSFSLENPYKFILYAIAVFNARRCPPEMADDCADGCIHSGSFNGKQLIRWTLFTERKFGYRNPQLREVIKAAKRWPQMRQQTLESVNMLSFDGGGIKGLITIQMVHELQRRLKRPFIEYFDWISGTSTGSIIAVCLALGKTTEELRAIYFRFKDKVMQGNRPYAAKLLEKLLQEEIGANLKMSDLKERYGKYILIPATLVDRNPVQLHLFRSYQPPEEMYEVWRNKQKPLPTETPTIQAKEGVMGSSNENMLEPLTALPNYKDQLVWQAVRASSAAPTFFPSFGKFVDGGLLANNPTMELMIDFNKVNYARARILANRSRSPANNSCRNSGGHWPQCPPPQRLNAVVSFGTGRTIPKPFTLPELSSFMTWSLREMGTNLSYVKDMLNIIVDSSCQSDYHVVDRNEAWCATNGVPFFRLNPSMNEPMDLNEIKDDTIIENLWQTKLYMHSKGVALDELVHFLESSYDAKAERTKQTKSAQSSNSRVKSKVMGVVVKSEIKSKTATNQTRSHKSQHTKSSIKRTLGPSSRRIATSIKRISSKVSSKKL